MSENEKKKADKCSQCHFYNKEKNYCKVKSTKEFRDYSMKDKDNCTDFLIKEKLVMF